MKLAWWALLAGHGLAADPCELGGVQPAASSCLAQLQQRPTRRVVPISEEGRLGPPMASCDTDAFKEVILLLHCRQTKEICDQRRSLLSAYREYFKDVRWMVAESPGPKDFYCKRLQRGDPGDPHICISHLLRQISATEPSSDFQGLLYMHFDAVISPCRFAELFNPQKLGIPQPHAYNSFDGHDQCNDPRYAYLNCTWPLWSQNKQNFFAARQELLLHRPELQWRVPELAEGCWKGFFDFFYLPRQVFATFAEMAKVFTKHNIHLEIAGPNLLQITGALHQMELQNYQCLIHVREGGLKISDITDAHFRCGHEVHYQDDGMMDAVLRVIQGDQREISQLVINETLKEPVGSLGSDQSWSTWLELPVVCMTMVALGVSTCCLEPFIDSLSRMAFSLLLCAVYVCISVVIDLSIARQATVHGEDYRFEPMCAVLLTEFLKLLVSLGLAAQRPSYLKDSTSNLTQKDVMWLVSAAAIFTVNNILLWWAIGQNDIFTFAILRDTMVLWTALLWRGIFGVALGWTRLAAIWVVFMGLVLNQVQLWEQATWSLAPLLVLAMTCCNAFGSVVNELALKQHRTVDINLQNSVLYFTCIILTLLTLLLSNRWRDVYAHGFFHGFTRHTMFTVILQALAGLSVSRILKYADAVQKTVASCLRGPILVMVSPAVVNSIADMTTFFSAAIVASGCLMYLMQGPLAASKA